MQGGLGLPLVTGEPRPPEIPIDNPKETTAMIKDIAILGAGGGGGGDGTGEAAFADGAAVAAESVEIPTV